MPLLGQDQVYVTKYGRDYHTSWCQVVSDKWDHAPRGLLVTMLADVGARSRCKECDRARNSTTTSSAQSPQSVQGHPNTHDHQKEPRHAMGSLPHDAVIPLRVVGVTHGILFLAAGPEHRQRLRETAVEPATPLYVGGRRDGLVVRVDAGRAEPLVVVQLDPRATFRDGPYQVRLRRPLQRSATKPYAVASVEPAPKE